MKKRLFIFSIIPMMLMGCLKEKDSSQEKQETPITIRVAPLAEVQATRDLGTIDKWFNGCEVYIAYGTSVYGTPESNPSYNKALKAFISNSITIFQPLLFYPGADYIYLKGFFPREGVQDFNALDSNRPITENKINYKITGQEDIMISDALMGWSAPGNMLEDQFLLYQHLLTRLSFCIKCGAEWPSSLKLTAIRVVNLSNEAVLDLSKDHTDPDVLLFSPSHDKALVSYDNAEGRIIPVKEYSEAFGNIMIESSSPFELEIEFSTGDVVRITDVKMYSDQSYTINKLGDQKLIERGRHYNILLDFNGVAVHPEAVTSNVIMKDWNTGEIVDGGQSGWW